MSENKDKEGVASEETTTDELMALFFERAKEDPLMQNLFKGGDLQEEDFREANLSKADLSEADLSRVNLNKADLSKAYLSTAILPEGWREALEAAELI